MQALIAYLDSHREAANLISMISSAVIAILAFLVSLVSLWQSRAALSQQRRHDILSVTPIPEITVADYEDCVRVKLRNHGSGPLIVTRLRAIDDEQREKPTLIEWMPQLPTGFYWTHFTGPVQRRSILPGEELVLLELQGDAGDQQFMTVRENCRSALASLKVEVQYTDVYDSDLRTYDKLLDWFARHQ